MADDTIKTGKAYESHPEAKKSNAWFDRIFAPDTQIRKLENEYAKSFQAMLDSKKASLESRRTSDARMATYNALGNALTTMVQPIGWAVGGHTAGVQKYDDRQYLDAFNRALKARDAIRDLDSAQDEFYFKLEGDRYNREIKNIEADDQRRKNLEDWKAKEAITSASQQALYNQRLANDLTKIDAQGEWKLQVEQFKASHRVTKGGISVDDRFLMMARKEFEAYKRFCKQSGIPVPSFEEYLKDQQGCDVSNAPSTKSSGGGGKPQKTDLGLTGGGNEPTDLGLS